jgi:IclR family KDG regulon transcriptional repressor
MSTTVIKGLQIIETLARNADPMGLTEISRALDMNQSAVQRILGVLTERGYVERPAGSRKYQLSLAIWELGSEVIEHHQHRRLVHPILRFAAQSTGFTAFLTYLDHPFLVYLDKVEGTHGRAHSTEPGSRIPVHRTAAGKAVLAYLPDQQLNQLAKPQKDWTGFLNFEATNLDSLRQELSEIRQRRYAISQSGLTRGVNSIAAPIWSSSSVPFGSIALTAEERDMPATAFQELGEKLIGLAREATIALGGTHNQQTAERAYSLA